MYKGRRRAPSSSDTVNHVSSARGSSGAKKQASGGSGFQEGAIVRIKLENILTYESVEFNTGSSLNVIIGPNGTGKSAIVCAICLGLAGKTNWLGRASSPGDFVRYGNNSGAIELELFNPDGEENYIIRRVITKDHTQSKQMSNWSVNGRPANLKSVEELVARLNIQVGNLVQFLPQEKVADFARMTQQELLENTEKAVGTAEMFELHQTLIEQGKQKSTLDHRLDDLRRNLDTEIKKNERLEPDVKNFKERGKFLEKVNILKMKRPWLEYQELKQTFEAYKVQRDVRCADLKEAQRVFAPLQKEVERLTQLKDTIETELKKMTADIKDNANKVSETSTELETIEDRIQDAKKELDIKKQEEDKRRKRVEDLNSQLNALKAEFDQLDGASEEHLLAELQQVNEKIGNVSRDINSMQQQGMEMHALITNCRREIQDAQNDLRKIQDVGNQRLEQLRRIHKHTYDAVMWLRQNHDRFKAVIHEPMILCLNLIDPRNAKFVETHIALNDLRAFVCEDADDLEQFMSVMRDEQRLRVNAVLAPHEPVASFKPNYPIQRLQQYGFYSYMKDLFECPDSVMAYLCKLYNVHKIPIGNEYSRKSVQKINKEFPEIRLFYADTVSYSFKTSRYDSSVSSRSSSLKDVHIFASSVDTRREQELQLQIQDLQKILSAKETTYRELQQEQQEKEREHHGLRNRKKELLRQKDQKKRLEQQIQTKQDSIQRVEREALNMEAEEQATNKKIKSIVSMKCDYLSTMHHHTQRCFEITKEKMYKSLKQVETLRKYSVLDAQLREQNHGLGALERDLERLQQFVVDSKQTAREKLAEAKKAVNMKGNEELPGHLRQVFDTCPCTVSEVDDEIHKLQARADSMYQVDEMTIQQYHNREKEIARLKAVVEEQERDERQMASNVTEMKEKWLMPLKNLIECINTNFGHFFAALDCAGEVDLNIPDDKEDYKNYGIRIRVKFRDGEQLRELTSSYQSGGERSVSTVLYMMALQELAKCPFRCVDEINQGMDPTNERKVFELVVNTVCRKNKSQYFLLTPKLLPDLDYADNMMVLCVNNGQHIMNHKHWNLRQFIQKGAEVNKFND